MYRSQWSIATARGSEKLRGSPRPPRTEAEDFTRAWLTSEGAINEAHAAIVRLYTTLSGLGGIQDLFRQAGVDVNQRGRELGLDPKSTGGGRAATQGDPQREQLERHIQQYAVVVPPQEAAGGGGMGLKLGALVAGAFVGGLAVWAIKG